MITINHSKKREVTKCLDFWAGHFCAVFFPAHALDWMHCTLTLHPWAWTSAEAASGSATAPNLQIHSPIPSFSLVQNFHWETRDTLRKPGLVAALSLYESIHTTSQTGFPHHTGCEHSLCLSRNMVSLVVQQNKRELGIQRKICQRLYNTKPLRVVWRMMKRTLEWIAYMSSMHLMSAQLKKRCQFCFWIDISISLHFTLLNSA